MRRAAILIATLLILGSCDFLPDYFGRPEAPPLPGERISILALENRPKADPQLADLQVRLPRPYRNRNWAQFGGVASHAMHHLEAPGALKPAWRQSVGEGASDDRRLIAQPIVADGRVLTFDAMSVIRMFAASDGRSLWRRATLPEDEVDDAYGGGLAVGGGRIFASTGAGEVIAFDIKTGEEAWRTDVGVPIRSAPTLAAGRVFVITYDNQLFALDRGDGAVAWSHAGIAETAQILGAPSPAVGSGIVIAAYSSGELFALRADNGRVIWSDALAFGRRTGALAGLSDINGSPVIDRDAVYAISRAGRLVALDLKSGERIWEQDIAGVQMPWVAGDFLYILTTDGDVLCLSRKDGRIRWVRPLPRYEEPGDVTNPILWTGPVLVSDRLLVVGSNGMALSISPYTGDILGRLEMPSGVTLAPIVADGTVYILADDADLIALR